MIFDVSCFIFSSSQPEFGLISGQSFVILQSDSVLRYKTFRDIIN